MSRQTEVSEILQNLDFPTAGRPQMSALKASSEQQVRADRIFNVAEPGDCVEVIP